MRINFQPTTETQQRQHEKHTWVYPVKLAAYATWLKNHGKNVVWDESVKEGDEVVMYDSQVNIPFLSLPAPDRVFTGAKNFRWQRNGNFKYHPATYIQVADHCWHGKCEFCVEKGKEYQVRPVWDVIDELKELNRQGFKEVFDDSGTFPVGKWLKEFLKAIKGIHPTKRVVLGCNMRLVDVDYRAMAHSGFRMLLFGVESANQETLDKISKGTKISDIKYLAKANRAGLDCHGAFMFGYPWETEDDAERTLKLVHTLLKKGWIRTAQASFYSVAGMQSNLFAKKYIPKIYDVWKSPQFWKSQIMKIKDMDDLKYLWRCVMEGLKR